MTAMERIQGIIGDGKTMDTLGGNSSFSVESYGNNIIIKTSSGYQYKVGEGIVNDVVRRYESLPLNQKHMASYYVRPRWPNCPNNRVSPYIARILKESELLS